MISEEIISEHAVGCAASHTDIVWSLDHDMPTM
jgi:hypothetical protein